MLTNNKKSFSFRRVVPYLLQNFNILYQLGELTSKEKADVIALTKVVMSDDTKREELSLKLKSLRRTINQVNYIDECIDLISKEGE